MMALFRRLHWLALRRPHQTGTPATVTDVVRSAHLFDLVQRVSAIQQKIFGLALEDADDTEQKVP